MRRPYDRFKMSVCNQSARNGTIKMIVIHSTEGQNLPGVTDLRNLGSWFDNPSAQASAHIGIDAEGNSATYVADARKAWHCANYNSDSLGIELVGKMSQTFWPDKQYRKAAKYVAYWSKVHRIPIRKARLRKWSGAVDRSGLITHKELGVLGGNHGDPGPHFSMRKLLWLARLYKAKGF